MVSQTMALIIVAALTSLVVAMTQKLNSETNASDAQVELREAAHFLLRDTQGVGGSISQAGDLITIIDGGATNPDAFALFKRDESICGGGITLVASGPPVAATVDVFKPTVAGVATCPFAMAGCATVEVGARRAMLMGPTRSIDMTAHTADAAACTISFPTGATATDVVTRYNTLYGTSFTTIANVMTDVFAGASPQLLLGSSFQYRIAGTAATHEAGTQLLTLQRATDGGAFADVVPNFFDLQIERGWDTDSDGAIDIFQPTTVAPPAASVFIGVRIGMSTFGRAPDGIVILPAVLSNRVSAALVPRARYRSSYIISTSRNSNGGAG